MRVTASLVGSLFWATTTALFAAVCCSDPLLPELLAASGKVCWGYEKGCSPENRYSIGRAKCPKPSKWPHGQTKREQMEVFYDQADFGYIKSKLDTMTPICTSERKDGAVLECTDHLRFCRGRNILFDFKGFYAKNSKRYRDDVIHEGEVGGRCDFFDRELLQKRSDEKSYLQSWGHELTHFESSEEFAVNAENCDVIFERPTIVLKLDASVNMYHHFCDFVNLFASQFLNGTFNDDVDIVWWETHSMGYEDRYFGPAWKAFSRNKPHELVSFDQKRVCFRNQEF
ncbi:hypothetical protein L596_004960 [Steinernema carpocapsae]|uniref:Uncharacterized protein n=1 Tax=Steinernema carpocapsae TaxID=34508 RepID=A0A4V6I8I6_STECR|nr:hypothetical protein L596_004960 [Steinernema carpocapsae]